MLARMNDLVRTIVCAGAMAIASICVGQSEIYVDDSAPAGGDGLSWQTAYNDLQDALDHDGGYSGEIRIAQGNYVPSENVNPAATFDLFYTPDLVGGYGGLDTADPDERDPDQYVTVLNGDLNGDDGPDFQNYGDNAKNVLAAIDPISSSFIKLDGLTIRGANRNGLKGRNAKIDVINCRFIENWTDGMSRGGAIYVREGFILNIEDSVFANNDSTNSHGGAIAAFSKYWSLTKYTVNILNSEFTNNSAAVGAAISASTNHNYPEDERLELNITGSSFQGNTAGGGGGAVFAGAPSMSDFYPRVNVLDSTFTNNYGEASGGAISAANSKNIVMNSTFILNETGFLGGGLDSSQATLVANSVFSANAGEMGGGIGHSSSGDLLEITNSTIHGSASGGGVREASTSGGDFAISNSILRNNLPDQIIGVDPTFVASYSNIQGVSAGTNIDADPMFVQPGTHNFRLHHDSPSINAGNDALLPEDVLDMDGDGDTNEPIPWDLDQTDRVQDGAVDHGAFEGGHDMQAPTAGGFLDPGDNLFLVPSGETFDPVQHTGGWVANINGQPGAYYEITELTGTLYPGAPGHHQLGTALDAETDIPAGDFMSVLFIPFDQSDLDGADPLSVNLTRYDPETGRWILAVAGNAQNSPDHNGPIGDRHILDDPEGWWNAVAMGNYGVYWDDDAGSGYVFAIVDRDGQFAFGDPTCPGDVYPAGVGDGKIDGHDLGLMLSNWGVGGEFGPADLNLDGIVDGADLGVLISNWGQCDSGLLPTGLGGSDVAPNWGPCAEDDPCVGDLTGDHAVTGRDLGILLAQWGDCPQRGDCIADLTGNGRVGHDDLAAMFGTAD